MLHASPRRRTLAAVACTAALAVTASGCAAFSDDTGTGGAGAATADGELSVVTSFYPLQYLTEQVAGDDATVTNLTQPGSEPHDLELTPALTAEIVDADLVVHESALQPSVADSIDQNAGGTALDVGEAADLVPFSEEEQGHEHEGEHEGEDHAHEEGHDEHEDGHDHGDLDPHFWLDAARMADVADAIADQLAEVDPDNADTYRQNAAAVRDDLGSLDGEYDQRLASCDRDTIVVSHDAFGYLEKYGVEVAPIAGLSPDAEPTPADLASLQDLIADDGITTVFYERLVSPRFSRALADDAGVETAVLDPIEGLSDETSSEDYVSLMESNLQALVRANGCS
ncbi:metal ABC transporter substrate-binding protein [Nocardioides marmoraquaticus]